MQGGDLDPVGLELAHDRVHLLRDQHEMTVAEAARMSTQRMGRQGGAFIQDLLLGPGASRLAGRGGVKPISGDG